MYFEHSSKRDLFPLGGGIVINGFGVTNKCSYTGTRGESNFALASECHIDSEGSAGVDENQYGGINDADNSGSLFSGLGVNQLVLMLHLKVHWPREW